MEGMIFDYYYGYEAEQFSFFRIPKALVKDERFKKLSNDAKLLYGLMLDRLSLSIKNGWVDGQNRAYIHYTVASVMEDLCCAKATCTKIMAELDSKKGIGLIEKKRQGLGRPDIIYVKNFTGAERTVPGSMETGSRQSGCREMELEEGESACHVWEGQERDCGSFTGEDRPLSAGRPYVERAEMHHLGFRDQPALFWEEETALPIGNMCREDLNSGKGESGKTESGIPEVQEVNRNYTDNNNTDFSKTNLINPISSINPISPAGLPSAAYRHMADVDLYRETVRRNIGLDSLVQTEGVDGATYIELYGLICDIVCVPRETVRIAGVDYPYWMVRDRFLSLGRSHLIYVVRCMQHTTSKVFNIRAYLLTALYNAPDTMGHYYQQEVLHDFYGQDEEPSG